MGALDELAASYAAPEEPESALDRLASEYSPLEEFGAADPALPDTGYSGALASGAVGGAGALLRAAQAINNLDPFRAFVSKYGTETAKENIRRADEFVERKATEREQLAADLMPVDPNLAQKATAAVPQLAATVIAAMTTGPVGAGILGGTMATGSSYSEAKSRGVDDDVATLKALAEGATVGPLEAVGGLGVLGRLGAKPAASALGRVVKRGLTGALSESVTEGTQRTASTGFELLSGREWKGLKEEGRLVGEDALIGGLLGGPLAGGMSTAGEANRASAGRVRLPADAPKVQTGTPTPVSPIEAAQEAVRSLSEAALPAIQARESATLGEELAVAEAEEQLLALRVMEQAAKERLEGARGEAKAQESEDFYDAVDFATEEAVREAKKAKEDVDWEDLDQTIAERAENLQAAVAAGTQFAGVDGKEASDAARALAHAEASAEMVGLQQQSDTIISALLDGDVTRFSEPEQFAREAAQAELKVKERREILKQKREALEAGALQAATMAQTPDEARRALISLRESALREAVAIGDPQLFDRMDIYFRRRAEAFPLDLDDTIHAVPPTLQKTLSTMRDAMTAAVAASDKQFAREYAAEAKAGTLPVDPLTGFPIRAESYVQDKRAALVEGFNAKFQSILNDASAKGADQNKIARKASRELKSLLEKTGLSPAELGFRADKALEVRGVIDDGAEWIKGVTDKPLSSHSEDQLVALSTRAHAEGAPLSVYGFVQAELARRAANKPPAGAALGTGDPQATIDAVNAAAGDLNAIYRQILTAPKTHAMPESVMGRIRYRARGGWARLKAQFRHGDQLARNPVIAHIGAGLSDSTAQMMDPEARNHLDKLLLNVRKDARSEAAVLEHEIAQAGALLDNEVVKYMQAEERAGRTPPHKDLLYLQMGDAYDAGQIDQLPPPLAEIVKTRVQPILNKYSLEAGRLAETQAEKVAIQEQMGRYLFRDYAVFHDPDAVFKKVDRKAPAYARLLADIRATKGGSLYDAAYEAVAKDLRGAGLQEPQIDAMVKAKVEEQLEGEIESLIKQHLRLPGQKSEALAPVVQKARREYLEERVLKDPNLRELMGQEKHLAVALNTSLSNIARDVSRFRMTKGLMDAWRTEGLVGETKAPGRAIPIDKRTLLPPDPADPDAPSNVIYATPDVANVLKTTKETADFTLGLDRLIAYAKSGLILNPGSWLQNKLSVPQTLFTSGGLVRTLKTITSRKGAAIAEAKALTDEIAKPGQGIINAQEGKRRYAAHGITPEMVERGAMRMLELGLDTGGEYTYELEQGTKAALEGARTNRKSGTLARTLQKGSEWYRRPDLFAKVLAFKIHLDDLMSKEGITSPTPEMEAEAATRALNTTQNPQTTPDFIRNFNKSALGLFTFNFSGFTYQMGRNLAYGAKYALQDLAHASLLQGLAARTQDPVQKAQLSAKATRYMQAGVDKSVGVGMSSVMAISAYKLGAKFLYSLLSGEEPEEAKETEKAIQYFSPYQDQRYSDVTVLKEWEEGGKRYALVANTGRVDIYDNLKQIVKTATDPSLSGIDKAKALAHSLQDQLMPVSPLVDGIAQAGDLKVVDGNWTYEPAEGGVERAARRIAPAAARIPYDVGKSIAKTASLPPEQRTLANRDVARLLTTPTRQITGVGVQVVPITDNMVKKFKTDWANSTPWVSEMRKSYKAASRSQRRTIESTYVEQWDKMMLGMARSREEALRSHHNPMQIRKTLEDEYTGMPKWMTDKIARGQAVPLSRYLSTIETE